MENPSTFPIFTTLENKSTSVIPSLPSLCLLPHPHNSRRPYFLIPVSPPFRFLRSPNSLNADHFFRISK